MSARPAGTQENSFDLVCDSCSAVVPPRPYRAVCPRCDGTIGFRYASPVLSSLLPKHIDSMWDFAPVLPVEHPEAAVTLGEGGTPLLRSTGAWGCPVWLKDETRNPTGSHKDRALSVAITRGMELGFRSCVVISAGSTGLSTAAYAARAGMRCAIVVPAGTPDARLLPLTLYGATVFEAAGTFEGALRTVEAIAREAPIYVTSTYRRGNPYQAEGAKTVGLEIASQLVALGQQADWIVVPTGGGGTVAGIWRAFQEIRRLGGDVRLPKLATVQTTAYNALELAMREDLHDEPALYALGLSEDNPTLLAKLQHGVPPDALYALAALRESGGAATSVSDQEALVAQRQLAAEGLFAEPSAAAALAGVRRLLAEGVIRTGENVVAVVTGSGFRELAALAGQVAVERTPLAPDALAQFLMSRR